MWRLAKKQIFSHNRFKIISFYSKWVKMLIKLFNKTWDTQEKESKKEKTQEWDNTSNKVGYLWNMYFLYPLSTKLWHTMIKKYNIIKSQTGEKKKIVFLPDHWRPSCSRILITKEILQTSIELAATEPSGSFKSYELLGIPWWSSG